MFAVLPIHQADNNRDSKATSTGLQSRPALGPRRSTLHDGRENVRPESRRPVSLANP